MKLKNTKTRKLEEFKPLSSREVKVYYCGPTVYNYAHIGNLRAYIFEDVVVKTLRFLGYPVKTVMNITDIDDKTIRDSQKVGMTLDAFTKKYTKIFLEDIQKLQITPADTITPISEVIPEMVRMIQTMLNRKNAYLSEDGSVYFDISTSKNYGELANLDKKNMKSSVRIDNDEYEKDAAADFVLWKSWRESDGENYWSAQFRIDKYDDYDANLLTHKNITLLSEDDKTVLIEIKGRPGWHIECSACNMKHFGPQIDIHMGGIDNLFPHHQNEVAQTEACTKKEFSKYWLHGGHLTVDGKKMAKSAGNFYTLKDLEEKYEAMDRSVLYRALRLSFMNAKYASSVDFSFEKLESNFSVIRSIDETVKNIKRAEKNAETRVNSKAFSDDMQDFLSAYIEHIEDDFNIPEALAVYHTFLKYANTGLREQLFSLSELQALLDMFATFDSVLSLLPEKQEDDIPENILAKLKARNTAKKEKDFEKADQIRDELLSEGYKIVDTREGSFVERL